MSKILITGGAGFIGSHLAERFVADGHEVHIVDDMSTGSFSNIPEGARLWKHDVSENVLSSWPEEVLSRPYDEVWHLASPASPDDFRKWENILNANVQGLLNVRHLVKPDGFLVIAGSSEAYGRTTDAMEESNCGTVSTRSVRGVYDESKRMLEAMAFQIALDNPDMRVLVPRIFNTYGPRMPQDGRVINTLVAQARSGFNLSVHGSGMQTRSFCYIDDLVEILTKLRPRDVRSGEALVINCGNDEENTVMQAAEMICSHFGLAPDEVIEYTSPRPQDPVWRRPDLTKLRAHIGEIDYTPLQEGISKCA